VLRKFEVTDWAVYILMNHWTATNTTGSNCHKNCQTCRKLYHLYAQNVPLQRVPRSQMSTNWDAAIHIKNRRTVWITPFIERAVGDAPPASAWLLLCWKQTFWAYNVKITFYDFWDNYCQLCLQLFNDSLKCTCQYCVDGSVLSLQFSQCSADTYFRWSRHFA